VPGQNRNRVSTRLRWAASLPKRDYGAVTSGRNRAKTRSNPHDQGKTLGAFRSPDVTPQGLAWDGTSFWVFTTNHGRVYEFQIEGRDTKTLGSFEAPMDVLGGDITNDLASAGKDLWYANQYNVYQLDKSGKILNLFAFPKNVMGLDWDGENLWIAYNEFPANAMLSVITPKGKELATFPSPIFHIDALAWEKGRLWAIGEDSLVGKRMAYELDVSRAKDAMLQP
jgi:hypothetical protein